MSAHDSRTVPTPSIRLKPSPMLTLVPAKMRLRHYISTAGTGTTCAACGQSVPRYSEHECWTVAP